MNTRNYSIDALRYIAVIAVIFIHCFNTCGTLKIVVDQLTRFAVPFFFVVSGYYLGLKGKFNDNNQLYFKYLVRVLKLYLAWSIIYFLNPNVQSFKQNGLASYYDKLSVFLHSGFENIFFIGISYHFWFFNSLLFTVLFFFFFKTKYINVFLGIAVLIYVFGVLGGAYACTPLGIHISMDTKNFIFFSSLPFALGVYIAINEIKIANKYALAIFMLGLFFHFIEMWLLRYFFNVYTIYVSYGFSTFLMGVGLLLIALNNNTWLNNKALASLGTSAFGVYACHLMIAYRLHVVADRFEITKQYWIIIYPILVLVISTVVIKLFKRTKILKLLI